MDLVNLSHLYDEAGNFKPEVAADIATLKAESEAMTDVIEAAIAWDMDSGLSYRLRAAVHRLKELRKARRA